MFLDEGPRTALCSVQRVFALKRTANLWIEMLKQVQHNGISDEELRTWTRSVGTKNQSSRRTDSWFWTKDGTSRRSAGLIELVSPHFAFRQSPDSPPKVIGFSISIPLIRRLVNSRKGFFLTDFLESGVLITGSLDYSLVPVKKH